MKREEAIAKLEEFLGGLKTEVDVVYFADVDELLDSSNPFDTLTDQCEEAINSCGEVIYYARAMEYLMDNDCSLNESMGLAAEMGYSPENLNSELLATLLKTQNIREEWDELCDEVDEFVAELVDELNDENEEE